MKGADKLAAQFRALREGVRGPVLRAAVKAGMKPALERATVNAAQLSQHHELHRTYKGRLVAPGFTSRSLRVITTISGDKLAAEAKLGVRKEAFYAVQFIERGWSRGAAHPWLVPAFQGTLGAQLEAMQAKLAEGIAKAAGK